MRIKLFLITALTLILSTGAIAQNTSVTIVPNKVVYKRIGQNVPDFKKTFEVTYPKISGIGNALVKNKLQNSLSYWKNFDTTLKEHQSEYHWLTSFTYKVNYNKNSVLDIELIMEGVGAYPDRTVKTLVVNLRTGNRLYVGDVFRRIGKLLVKIDKAQKAEIRKAIADSKTSGEKDGLNDLGGLLNQGDYTLDRLEEFSISDKGVTFLHDYGFPHAVRALEPEGRYFFSWNQMRSHIKRDGLLAKFIS